MLCLLFLLIFNLSRSADTNFVSEMPRLIKFKLKYLLLNFTYCIYLLYYSNSKTGFKDRRGSLTSKVELESKLSHPSKHVNKRIMKIGVWVEAGFWVAYCLTD